MTQRSHQLALLVDAVDHVKTFMKPRIMNDIFFCKKRVIQKDFRKIMYAEIALFNNDPF